MSINGFWRDFVPQSNQQIALGKAFGLINAVHYIFPQGGGPRGAYPTFAAVKSQLQNRDLIVISGVLREQAVAPDGIFDVTIIGAANTPRQATSGGTPTGGGASWIAPTSAVATTPLFEVTRSGWQFINIEFTPHTSSAGVRLTRSASVDLIDASHASFYNCYFCGQGGTGQIGIEDNGGSSRVFVEGCRFELLTGTAILSLNTANSVPLGWLIEGCRFQQNTNDVKMSLSYAIIQRNNFMTAGSGATNKVVSTTFISVQGGNNFIIDNQFKNVEAEIAPANGYTGASSDVWRNFVTDGTWYAIGQPA